MHEFQIIQKYFTTPPCKADLGVGDDGALFRIEAGHQCVVTSDMLVSGRHFYDDVDARALGHKALAVNLSDLAAMGAEPVGFTLSLALPSVDESWLAGFSRGMLDLAAELDCDLIGGDTTNSNGDNLVINITAFGQVPVGEAIQRNAGQIGDDIWVSGTLGDAACALKLLQKQREGAVLNTGEVEALSKLRSRLEMPTPRVGLGMALRGLANSMLDLSDGLAGDLMHLLRASGVNAEINCDALPLSSPLNLLNLEQQWQCALTGGDDYELCFSAPAHQRETIITLAMALGVQLARIGELVRCENSQPAIRWTSEQSPASLVHMNEWRGYNHFL